MAPDSLSHKIYFWFTEPTNYFTSTTVLICPPPPSISFPPANIPSFHTIYLLDKLVSLGTHSDSIKTQVELAKWLHMIIKNIHEVLLITGALRPRSLHAVGRCGNNTGGFTGLRYSVKDAK